MLKNIVFKIFLALLLLTGFSLVKASMVEASDGFIELRSTVGDSTRCHITSVRLQNLEYQMPFVCRDLKYTGDAEIVNYVVWITPVNGGGPINVGVLGLGRGIFKTKAPFSTVYVTVEEDARVKVPTGRIVLQGSVAPIPFLEEVSETSVPSEQVISPTGSEKAGEIPTAQLSTRQKLVLAFQRAGIAALVALVALIGLVFVITRSRG